MSVEDLLSRFARVKFKETVFSIFGLELFRKPTKGAEFNLATRCNNFVLICNDLHIFTYCSCM